MTTHTEDRHCWTCAHWGGDKEKTARMIKDCPTSMDMVRGWPNEGSCEVFHRWATMTIDGDAIATVEVAASFGCVMWES